MTELRIAKDRLLRMCAKLSEGQVLYKKKEADAFGCSLRSIQRDIDDLRAFFSDRNKETGMAQELIYDRELNGYRLEPPNRALLSDEETFAVIKILLESRSLTKTELLPILEKLVTCCVPETNRRQIDALIANESFHYVEPRHKTPILHTMWDLSAAVRCNRITEIVYRRLSGDVFRRAVKPVGILFSEFYFYLIAFIDGEGSRKFDSNVQEYPYPAIYRMDRIREFTITEEHFHVPYMSRFEEGEFRKRVQFMYPGELQQVKFYVKSASPEAALDRLPTAKVLGKDEKGYLISAEVFGCGIDMWLRSQGQWVELAGQKKL